MVRVSRSGTITDLTVTRAVSATAEPFVYCWTYAVRVYLCNVNWSDHFRLATYQANWHNRQITERNTCSFFRKTEKSHVCITCKHTSSPAVAERPRDTSCLSVVSFNSTIRRAQIYRCVQVKSVLFASLWSSTLVVINKNSMKRGGVCGKLHGGRSQLLFALHRSRFLPTQPTLTPPSEYCHEVWYGEKFLKICLVVSTESTNVTDRQTDTRTDGHRITARHSMARQKNTRRHVSRYMFCYSYFQFKILAEMSVNKNEP